MNVITIREPMWKDKSISVAIGKIGVGKNKIVIEKGGQWAEMEWMVDGTTVKRDCSVRMVSKYKIPCFKIPLSMLEPYKEDE